MTMTPIVVESDACMNVLRGSHPGNQFQAGPSLGDTPQSIARFLNAIPPEWTAFRAAVEAWLVKNNYPMPDASIVTNLNNKSTIQIRPADGADAVFLGNCGPFRIADIEMALAAAKKR